MALLKNSSERLQTKEYGDYQTPENFVEKVCLYLKNTMGLSPNAIFEPTSGNGNFIKGSLKIFPNIKKIFGIEINKSYFDYSAEAINKLTSNNISIRLFNENIFTFDFNKIKSHLYQNNNLLIIGNPPWITNSVLSSMKSENLPVKSNLKNLKGLDAITGKSNFDIAEYIILLLLNEFKDYNCHIAMLCKNIVAKNIVRDLKNYNINISDIRMLTFDAENIFNINCGASLLIMKISEEKRLICNTYDFDNHNKQIKSFGWINDVFVSDIDSYSQSSQITGRCQFEWRQGIKHDCSKIMELSTKQKDGTYRNGFGKNIDIESDYIYPLLKSSDLKNYIITETKKTVIITQKKIKDDTNNIKKVSPKLWKYLNENSIYLNNRKSSIYVNAPKFSIFGIGDYSFKPYKVVVSGFYKEPKFILTYGNKPIMLDDTCYFIGFDEYKTAFITMLLMNSKIVNMFLKSIAFLDSKRPYTKEVLMKINFLKVVDLIDFVQLISIANELNIKHNLNSDDYNDYKSALYKVI